MLACVQNKDFNVSFAQSGERAWAFAPFNVHYGLICYVLDTRVKPTETSVSLGVHYPMTDSTEVR